MALNFECFVIFNDKNYDLVINDDISSVCFTNIFEKIQQIIRVALNQNISFETHLFEIVDSNKCKIIDNLETFIKHGSVIRVLPKRQFFDLNHVYHNSIDSYYELQQNQMQTGDNINNSQSYIPHEYYCNICPVSVDRVSDPRLKKLKLDLNFDSYKRYSDMLEIIKDFSNNRCDSITDYEWFNIIPFKMRSFGYKNFVPKNWKHCFDYFMECYITVLEKSPNSSTACSLFPFLHEFNSMILSPDKSYYKKVIQLRESLKIENISENINKSEDNSVVKSPLEKTLESKADEIKCFHLMIQIIYMKGIPFAKKVKHKPKQWTGVSSQMIAYGYKDYNIGKCDNEFHNWAKFYAENFDAFDKMKVNKNASDIFDLLKIIHTIDLTHIYSEKNATFKKIMKIGESDQIKDYLLKVFLNSNKMLSDLNNEQKIGTKVQTVENKTETSSESHDKNEDINRVTNIEESECLAEVLMDLENDEPAPNETVINEEVIISRDPRNKSITSEKFITPRDPQISSNKQETADIPPDKQKVSFEGGIVDNSRDPRKRPKIVTSEQKVKTIEQTVDNKTEKLNRSEEKSEDIAKIASIDKIENLTQVSMGLMNLELDLEESINEEIKAILRDPINEIISDEEVMTRDPLIRSIKREVIDISQDRQKISVKQEKADSPHDPRKRSLNQEVVDSPRDPRKRPKIKTR